MKKGLLFCIIATVLCAGVLVFLFLSRDDTTSAHRDTDPEQTTITLVYAYQNSQWNACVEDAIRRFEEANAHIDVQYEIYYEDTVYEDLLFRLAARDELGDVVQIKEPYVWAESGLIAPLPETLTNQVDTTCTVAGNTYGVCALGTTAGIIYNKAVFDRLGLSVPQNYAQFLSLCRTLKDNGVTPLGVGGKDLWHFEHWMNYFLRADILSAEPDFLAQCSSGERDWSDPLITTMLTHLNELFAMGFVDESWPSTPDGSLSYLMAEEQVAMVFSGSWMIPDVLSQNPALELGWFYLPNEDGVVVAGESLDVFWTVTADCAADPARYEAAVSFLSFFYSEGLYEEIYTAMAGFSMLNDRSRDRLPSHTLLQKVNVDRTNADQRIHAYVGDENTPPGFEKNLLTLISRMCSGELTVAQTQAAANEYWREALAQEVAYAP
ncbi:MAG: extracellular solute-binding protein [Oscillospiraceae bacterium]|nr:extracellular solute-binding protein [Oscillospiraceae bacterium]